MKFLDKQDKKILMLKRLSIAADHNSDDHTIIKAAIVGAATPIPYKPTPDQDSTDSEGNLKINSLISQKSFEAVNNLLENNKGETISTFLKELDLFTEYDLSAISQSEVHGQLSPILSALLDYALLEKAILH